MVIREFLVLPSLGPWQIEWKGPKESFEEAGEGGRRGKGGRG